MIYLKSVCKALFLNSPQIELWKARFDFQISFSSFELGLSDYLWVGKVLCLTLVGQHVWQIQRLSSNGKFISDIQVLQDCLFHCGACY